MCRFFHSGASRFGEASVCYQEQGHELYSIVEPYLIVFCAPVLMIYDVPSRSSIKGDMQVHFIILQSFGPPDVVIIEEHDQFAKLLPLSLADVTRQISRACQPTNQGQSNAYPLVNETLLWMPRSYLECLGDSDCFLNTGITCSLLDTRFPDRQDAYLYHDDNEARKTRG